MATINAINTGKPIEVASGGTGVASITAYTVICGGTTATDPVQPIASVGSATQVLTSNGVGALPSFQAAPATSMEFQILASDPGSPSAGQVWFNTTSNTFKGYNGAIVTFTVT